MRHILDEGMRGAQELQQQQAGTASSSSSQRPGSPQWPLMYSWHNKHYLGAAHGESVCHVLCFSAGGGAVRVGGGVQVGACTVGRCAAHGGSMRSASECSVASAGRGGRK